MLSKTLPHYIVLHAIDRTWTVAIVNPAPFSPVQCSPIIHIKSKTISITIPIFQIDRKYYQLYLRWNRIKWSAISMVTGWMGVWLKLMRNACTFSFIHAAQEVVFPRNTVRTDYIYSVGCGDNGIAAAAAVTVVWLRRCMSTPLMFTVRIASSLKIPLCLCACVCVCGN